MTQIICKNVTLGYDGKKVIENLSFIVNAGDYLCIIGENGSGKTTLMKALLKLKSPISGEITIGSGLKATEIGYLPQQTKAQRDFPASVREIVQSGCLNHCGLRPYFNRKEKRLADSSMERLGIGHLAKRCYRELSGGQQQRVLLARGLCAAGKVLLLDEPVSGLDPKATREMYELIYELNDCGITIIMISHDMNSAVKYATHILQIGEQTFFGTKEDYMAASIGTPCKSVEGGKK